MLKKLFFLLLTYVLCVKTWAVDVTPPTTTYSISPSSPDGDNGWYVHPVTITLNATDLESGVATIKYRLNGGSWITTNFSQTLNLAPNPSFETTDPTSNINTLGWVAREPDAQVTPYSRDSVVYLPGYENYSIKINANSGGWHWISNQTNYAVATPYSNMTASVWLKTDAVEEYAGFEVYALLDDFSSVLLGTSTTLMGTNDWTQISSDFNVNVANPLGVYLTMGVYGKGVVYMDGVTISDSLTNTSKEVIIGTDNEYTMEYYSTDRAGNNETYSCPLINCKTFKIDTHAPGNWHDAGAFRGIFGNSHQLYVYTTVEDPTSGLSTFTDKYQYMTDKNPGSYGSFSNLLSCNSTWQPGDWTILISPPFFPGVHSAYLLTPKTDFCNNDWKTCKSVLFYSRDMAGNVGTKYYCINGPWMQLRGGGIVRSNNDIDMVSEPEDDSTDGLIDAGGATVSFFTSSMNWEVTNNPMMEVYDYDRLRELVAVTPTDRSSLTTNSGVYRINGDFEIRNSTKPSGYESTNFNQIFFIDGDLTISNDVVVANGATAAFIVNGNIEISKNVDQIGLALIANDEINTASDLSEGEGTSTLELNGLISANRIIFSRTLQGTNNEDTPAEDYTYEPKYLLGLRDYFGKSDVVWVQE